MSARDAIGWGALGAGACAALVLAIGHFGASADADRAEEAPAETTAAAAKSGQVNADKAFQARIGLKVVVATSATTSDLARGFARGLDSGPLAAIEAEIATAKGAAQASAAEAARLVALAAADESASRQSVEAARAIAIADAARVRLAEQRIALEYGIGLARLGENGRHALLAAIANGTASLVRVDIPGASTRNARLTEGGARIELLGPAAAADAKLQTPGMIGIVRGDAARRLNNGLAVEVVADGSGVTDGIAIPADAVVRWHDGLWVYRQTGAETFERVELADARPIDNRWFVPAGLAAGDRVVVDGAGTLLALDRAGDVTEGGDD
ncbi:MAG: hypothetical protein WC816_13745 [Sphingomonas sp.]|jgi:hypothetical protein